MKILISGAGGLIGARVIPQRLLDSGYRFTDPELAAALRRMLVR